MIHEPKLSVVIPVYGTEKYLPICLDSVLASSYSNIEIVVVNDKSPGDVKKIVIEYQESFNNIQYVEHAVNRGLYRARITGVESSTGDYIAFLDSDDFVSVDFYRRLMNKAQVEQADMVMGDFYLWEEDKWKYFNLSHMRIMNINLYKDEVTDLLFNEEGKDYTLWVVWNKIYSRALWNKAYPYLNRQDKHIIMTEDILFSCLLFYFSQHFINVHGDFIAYRQIKSSSTKNMGTVSTIRKNLIDINVVFSYIEEIFNNDIEGKQYVKHIEKWKSSILRGWKKRILESSFILGNKRKLIKEFNLEKEKDEIISDYFFYLHQTEFEMPQSERLKKLILDPTYKVISFDIFDTLIVRPFAYPTDIFKLLNYYVDDLLEATDQVDFSDIRIEGEKFARSYFNKLNNFEEITLDEIYESIHRLTGWNYELLENIKNKEIDLEKKYCLQRKFGKELFDLAKYAHKKVIITSDMYLPQKVVNDILLKNGYSDYDKLYLSSEVRVTKASGKLYSYISKQLNCSPKEIIHIGDNLDSDYKSAQKQGLKAVQLPKTMDCFQGYTKFNHQNLVEKIFNCSELGCSDNSFNEFWGIRALVAVVANRFFDNPFFPLNFESDFNIDPVRIGYYCLGMHLFAIAGWLFRDAKQYDHINFMARDGFLPMKAFQLFAKYLNDVEAANKCNYVYLTRSVVTPMQVRKREDIYNLRRNITFENKTPYDIFKYYKEIIGESVDKNNIKDFCKKYNFSLETAFTSASDFYSFLNHFSNTFLKNIYAESAYLQDIKKYLDPLFSGKSMTYDVGYSARIESLLKRVYGYDVTPYYMHVINDLSFYRAKRADMEVHTFYDYTPRVTGVLRELMISEDGPSCNKLVEKNGKIVPVFKKYESDYIQSYILYELHTSAIQFVEDVLKIFREDIFLLNYRKTDASLPFEYYLHCSKSIDRNLFSSFLFEDDMGIGRDISVLNFWNSQTGNISCNLESMGKWKKGFYLLIMDRRLLKIKVKHKFSTHPRLLKLLGRGYKMGRWVYRKVN